MNLKQLLRFDEHIFIVIKLGNSNLHKFMNMLNQFPLYVL